MEARAGIADHGGAVTAPELAREVVRLRLVETRLAQLVRDGELDGSVLHVGIGQEGVAAGVAAARRPGDVLVSTHRGVAHCLAWGCDLEAVVAECFGRRGGPGGGLVGHMHLVDLERDVLGTNGIVGGGLPVAAGAALALQHEGAARCVIAFFGDGAANTGAMHEALNLAAVWRLPLLLVCENNGFQEMTRSAALTAGTATDRAAAYGIPAVSVDGADPVAVHAQANRLLVDVRRGAGPALIECHVFRVDGHWVGDSQHYRSPEDREAFADHDPVLRVLASAGLTAEAGDALRAELDAEADAAITRALAQARPTAADLTGWIGA